MQIHVPHLVLLDIIKALQVKYVQLVMHPAALVQDLAILPAHSVIQDTIFNPHRQLVPLPVQMDTILTQITETSALLVTPHVLPAWDLRSASVLHVLWDISYSLYQTRIHVIQVVQLGIT